MRLPTTALWTTLTALPFLPLLNAAGVLQQITDFPNPTKAGFYLYVPSPLPPGAPILVSPHWCHGSAQAVYSGSSFAKLADRHGFLVIYPDSPNTASKCWDVSSPATLTHEGGGDSLAIVNMVRWTLKKHGADAKRVFVTGVSSGAMMTNVLLAVYPDVFAAGTAFAGVAAGCFAAPKGVQQQVDYWNSDCANGKIKRSAAEWAAVVQGAYPAYKGWRPKVQVCHGMKDDVLNYVNFGEEVKQWTGVFGLAATPTKVEENVPFRGWTKSVYGRDGWFEAYSAKDATHDIGNHEDVALAWFDLACKTGECFKWGRGGPLGNSSAV